IRGQILNLLTELQEQLGLSYVLVSHDLSVVRDVADRVAVMYLGKIVEVAGTASLYDRPRHPYTRALISAVPVPARGGKARTGRIVLQGETPDASDPPTGCRFRTRCWKAQESCAQIDPPLRELDAGHWAACHFPEPSIATSAGALASSA
ncbi:MAG: oligopeptide/dipeptide ABC transporter ATP-binding protein, partial [Chloroflexota bacterium]